MLIVVFISGPVQSQNMSKFQAIFIHKFTQYIKWPRGNDKLVFGVLGSSTVSDEMQKLIDIKGVKNIEVRRLETPEMAGTCDLIFVPSSQDKNFTKVKTSVAGKNILVITESENLAKKGAGISFFIDEGRLKFKLNKSLIEGMNMKVSGSLLGVAVII
jgi:hypothetical protein